MIRKQIFSIGRQFMRLPKLQRSFFFSKKDKKKEETEEEEKDEKLVDIKSMPNLSYLVEKVKFDNGVVGRLKSS